MPLAQFLLYSKKRLKSKKSVKRILIYFFIIILSSVFLLFYLRQSFAACTNYTITSGFYCWCNGRCYQYTATCVYQGHNNAQGQCVYSPSPTSKSVAGTRSIPYSPYCISSPGTWYPSCAPQEDPCTGCNDCTLPTCAKVNNGDTNYTTDETGDGILCKGNSATCTKRDSCGNGCGTKSVNCYHIETNNTNPSNLSTIRIDIDGLTGINLSQDESARTLIKLPISSSSPTKIIADLVSKPTGSGEFGYRFFVNKADQFSDRLAITSDLSDSVLNEMPGLPEPSILTENATGFVGANVYSRNRCDNGTRDSSILKGYYRVNTLPKVISLDITGEPTVASTGCTAASRYTGQEANNPLTVTVTGSDINGTNTINGMFLWIVKDGTNIPSNYLKKRYPVGPGRSQNTQNMIGIFFALGSNSTSKWVTVYKAMIDSSGNLTGWGRDANASGVSQTYIKDSAGNTLIESIEVAYPEINDNKITFKANLKFPTNSKVLGNYKFYTSLTDTLSYYKIGTNTYTELQSLTTNPSWTWNFDFVNPTIGSFTSTINDQRQATVSWQSNDTESGVKDTVVNVYNSIPDRAVKRIEPLPEAAITVLGTPTSSLIGKIDPLSSGWYYNSPINSTKIDIHENDSGLLQFYITAYDQACNYITSDATSTPSFDLNRWISTKGGVLFSQGKIGYIPKDIAGQEYNLGTELITTTHTHHPSTLSMSESFKNPTSVINVTDGNTLEPNRFDLLKLKLDKYKLGFKSITSLDQCGNKEVCIWESKESINIGSTNQTGGPVTITTYQGKILVVSEQDIIVRPPIITIPSIEIKPGIEGKNPETSGLILFARGNIVINSESRTTGGTVEYDQIEAFMIARGQIQISAESSSLQDGVMVSGSLISFASNDNNRGILLQRDLGLLNVTNPVLVVTYHPKYAKISEIFFGKDNSAYKQEVGFKIW